MGNTGSTDLRPDFWKLRLVPGWDAEVLGDLPQGVEDTITSARAQSTRHAYALKWNLFDLSLVLTALQKAPFEPSQLVKLKLLSMKTLLLLALASIKRVGDLHAFLVDKSCLEFGPADSQVILRPRPGYVPKVPTTFRDQAVSPRGGGPSPSFALSRPSPKMVCRPDTKLQDLRPALCLLRRPAEGECRLQAEDGPLDSGCHHPSLPGTG
ncbi:hypothetical protein M9458_054594 [Cirrhinus mrigala]|uniref:Uncharacterized protein n=1 Tax=Cirrhinus mrigala TaxID=683832 RepID=A0ABD0MJC2_CIRMR